MRVAQDYLNMREAVCKLNSIMNGGECLVNAAPKCPKEAEYVAFRKKLIFLILLISLGA